MTVAVAVAVASACTTATEPETTVEPVQSGQPAADTTVEPPPLQLPTDPKPRPPASMEPPGPRAEPDCAPPAPPLPGPGGDTQSAIYGYVAGGLSTQCQWTSDPTGSSSGEAGVNVKITGDLYGAGTTDTTVQTDTKGCYLFAGLASATVPVSFTVSLPGTGLTHACDPDGTADGTTEVTVSTAGADVGPIRFGVGP